MPRIIVLTDVETWEDIPDTPVARNQVPSGPTLF